MNILLSDQDSYPSSGTGITSPSGTNLKLFTCNYSAAETMKSDPLNFTMWDNSTNKIKVPAQLKGYTITVNISLKYPAQASNAGSTRFAAYTGNATLSGGLYASGGTKLKDLYFKLSKVNTGGTVRDELVLSPIIVTQDIIDHGIYLFLGASDVSFYEPILTIDYGVVNTGLN